MSFLALGAIVRNELPYLLEWIAFHRVVGVERFVLVDDGSTDGTSDLLGRLAALGVVEHIRLIRRKGVATQLPAYRRIARRLAGGAEWIAFIDADEFILPLADVSLRRLLEAAPPDTGAMLLNWACYGSSGAERQAPEPVIERFTRRAAGDWHIDYHVKSIVRSRAFAGTGPTPHCFALASGWVARQVDFRPYVPHPQYGEGLSERLLEGPVRLNHYIIKSRQEFLERKRPRGRPDVVGELRPLDYFDAHDRNERLDPVPAALLDATRAEMARLEALLASRPTEPLLRRLSSLLAAARHRFLPEFS